MKGAALIFVLALLASALSALVSADLLLPNQPVVVAPEQVRPLKLTIYEGDGSTAQGAIGDAGRENVRAFGEWDGGYRGICAGAYLACAGCDWGLSSRDAKIVSPQWRCGGGTVRAELTDSGRDLFGAGPGAFTIRYRLGPIIHPLGCGDLPSYRVAALLRPELAKNATPFGEMVHSAASGSAPFGHGRVLTLRPPAEDPPGLGNLIPRALAWLAAK